MRVDVVSAIMVEENPQRLLSDVIAAVPPLPVREVGVPGGKAGPGRKKKTSSRAIRLEQDVGDEVETSNPTTRLGRGADYQAARINRDHPDIAARINEYPSMKAASRAAGFIKKQTRLDKIKTQWKNANDDERAEITAWFVPLWKRDGYWSLPSTQMVFTRAIGPE